MGGRALSGSEVKLCVGATWDGRPIDADEQARLTLTVGQAEIRVTIDAPFHDDPRPSAPPGPTDGLWDYEVVELFLLGADQHYTEVEFGPHGHHPVLQLEGARQPVARCLPMAYRATIDGARWRGEARLARKLLPPGRLRVNAYAIHGAAEERRYLAMTPVPGASPDFHRLACFEVELPVSSNT